MSNRYNIAIVGTGRIIKAHVSAIKEIPGFNIAGIYGRDFSRAKDTASGLGIKAFKEYDEILNDPEVHVVDIANSSDLHAQYGIEAAKHRKNLIIEKPIDTSEEKASELIRVCEKNNCLLGVIYQRRFDESAVLLRELIKENVFGKITSGSIVWGQRRDLKYYLEAKDGNKGVLINNGIHYIDLVLYLLDEGLKDCKGVLKKTRPELNVEDYAEVSLEFKDAIFKINMTTNLKKSIPTVLTVNGEKGSVTFEGERIKFSSIRPRLKWRGDFLKFYLAAGLRVPLKFRSGTHRNVFMNYLNALEGRQRVSAGGEDAMESLKAVNRIYRNNRSNLS